jgi:hypothetical protein
MAAVPRLRPRVGPIGIALTTWDIYRRLSPKQRRQVQELVVKHGPRLATSAAKAAAIASAKATARVKNAKKR